jgi:uncharacterized protein
MAPVEATAEGLTFIDSDGHVIEHAKIAKDLAAYAPIKWKERIIESRLTDMPEYHEPSETDDPSARLMNPMMRPGGHDAKARVADMSAEGISVSVLYPTFLLGVQSEPDVDFAEAQCRAYNNWLSDHVSDSDGHLWGAAVVPQQDIERAAQEIRRVAKLPGMKAAFIRPNPSADWKPFSHEIYNPIWEAATSTGLALGLHPFLAPDLPGACLAFRLGEASHTMPGENAEATAGFGNVFFTQAIANPVDMMNSMTFLLGGGVCERYPELKVVFLEANGGWVVPWLERLDHHYEVFTWDVPWLKMKPSEYFRRQCWISFDTDESTLAHAANSPLVGADRIVWASDYPHPDAKIPGVTKELRESISSLTLEQQKFIAGGSAVALYDL